MAEAADFQGTRPSPARRWLRRTGAVLAGTPLLAGLLQLPAASPAEAAAAAAPKAASDDGSVAVSVDSLTPGAPAEGDTVTVTGTVTNKGKKAVTKAAVGLRVGPLMDTRSSIDTVAKNSGDVDGPVGSEIDDKYSEKFSKLAPGVSQPYTLSVPADELDLGQDGVYDLSVTLTGETSDQPWEQTLGVRHTFLPWQPDEADTKTRTTFMWPLISTVHMTAETGSDEEQTPVFLDDELAAEISPGGRLDRMVALGRDLDVTWVIDPDLLASVEAMTTRYEIPGENADDKNAVGGHQEVAKRWLTEVQRAVADKEVVALPFGDPDLASLAHHGTSVTGSLRHLKEATDVASGTVESILHVKPSTDFAWPVEGAVDPSIVKVSTSAGADKVIARGDSLEGGRDLTYTPTAPRPIGGGTAAVVADARLSTVFEGDMTRASASTQAVQRFLAQSLTLALQTDRPRSVVVAPQRTPSAAQAQTMAEAVAALQNSTWSQPQDLTAAAKSKPDPAAGTEVPSASAYPKSLRKQELPRSAFEADRPDAGQARPLQGDPLRPVPCGHALRPRPEPGHGGVLARPAGRGGDLPQRRRDVPGHAERPGPPDREVGDQALRPQRHHPRDGPEQPGAGRRAPGAVRSRTAPPSTCRTATTRAPRSTSAWTTSSARQGSSVMSRTPSRTSSATSSRAAPTPTSTRRCPSPGRRLFRSAAGGPQQYASAPVPGPASPTPGHYAGAAPPPAAEPAAPEPAPAPAPKKGGRAGGLLKSSAVMAARTGVPPQASSGPR
ncbi:hypothetical protein STENM223S_04361 [Streptomyces tendae]